MTTEKKEKLLTPVGNAKWAHVFKPEEAFSKKEKPKFKIDVCFDEANPDWKPFCANIRAMVDALPASIDEDTGKPAKRKYPMKREMDKDDKPTGRWFIQFKSGEQYPPKVFDKFNQPMDGSKLIGNESKVRISCIAQSYEGFGGGITLYMNAVQVIELVEYKGSTAESYGFTAEAGQPGEKAATDPTVLPKDHPDYLPF